MIPKPYYPIIYVRGFAATPGEIEETVADPYMGFNVGSTKSRLVWNGDMKRFFFESPLVRLMTDHDYDDVFVEGEDLIELEKSKQVIAYKCIIIYRYYDEASKAFGTGNTPPITHFARGLDKLITRLRDKVCANPANNVAPADFRCYLIAHSMGGLVCRAFLQGSEKGKRLGSKEAREAVDKVFTYATPHNGIDLRVVRNVPGWVTFGDVNNFSRPKMAGYLGLKSSKDVSVVNDFPPERIFNLVGTNPADYRVLGGLSSWAVGEASDGLVCIDNATTHGSSATGDDISSPRAFVHRSHSGHYGIVNSEEGYQNLTRFLFGDLRVDGILDIDSITFPPAVQREYDADRKVRASYQFEVVVSIRGCQWQMHRRTQREHSAIFRTFDELLPKVNGTRTPDRTRSPHLFSVFLDRAKSVEKSDNNNGQPDPNASVAFAFDLSVLVPDYEVDGAFFLKRHYEGAPIYRKLIVVEAKPRPQPQGEWDIYWGLDIGDADSPSTLAPTTQLPNQDGITFSIPIENAGPPGLAGSLRIEARNWR